MNPLSREGFKVIKTRKGKIFGGFASVSWEFPFPYTVRGWRVEIELKSCTGTPADVNAFLFSVDMGIKNPVNLSSSNKPIVCNPCTGPYFGENNVFHVPANANTDISSGFYV
jgi:hypothetical protein